MSALCLVLRRLSPKDVARAQAVCKEWRECASLPHVIHDSFCQHWCLRNVSQLPPKWALAANLETFVFRHPLQRSDSLASLSIQFNLTPSAIKMTNNLVSEILASRTHIYLPVRRREDIAGRTADFVRCPVARKNFVVVSDSQADSDVALLGRGDQEVRGPAKQTAAQATGHSETPEKMLEDKMVAFISRSEKVDEGTARYYLRDACGDMRQAIRMAQADRAWESDPYSGFSQLKIS